MNIKRVVKFSFILVSVLILILTLTNFIALYQIKQNNALRKNIVQIVSMQDSMSSLLEQLFNTKSLKELEKFEKSFIKYEKSFEKLRDKIKLSGKNFYMQFIKDLRQEGEISKNLKLLYKNEKKIEKMFETAYVIQKSRINYKDKLQVLLPREKELRYILADEVYKSNDMKLIMLFDDMKYYSKEALYQYKDEKSVNKWIKSIKPIENFCLSSVVEEYISISKKIGDFILKIEDIRLKEERLTKDISNILEHNKKISYNIEKMAENFLSSYINTIYIFIFFLFISIIVLILILSYRVYKNVGLSVDEIESRVKEGLEKIQKLNKEIEDTQKEVVFTMGAIAEQRSKETGNHVKRVARYSELLAKHYGLSKEECELLKQASPMHDIGKVAIPDSILNKPGRFNDKEREIMNTHAKIGYDMLKHSDRKLLKAAAIVAYEHHEKWDGNGYPRGLKGEDIHIYGRITALADVFDALGSDRVYKKAWDDERIFTLIKEERAKHFDPKLVDIFFEHLDEFLKIRDSLKDKF